MKKNIIFLLAILVLGILIFYNLLAVQNFAGRFIYPLDDSYIHLSIAKNFAESGTWGITKYEFSSTTSSPFFTLLLAVLIRIFGNWEYLSFVANIVAGLVLLYILHRYLKNFSTTVYAVVLLAIVLLMPLHLMIMMGMEHVFHTLMMILVLITFEKYLEKSNLRNFSLLVLFSVFATGFRYESLFFIIFICIYLFFIRKEFAKSIVLGIFTLLPVLVYGWISLQKGSFFLPNSLILKGNTNDELAGFLRRVVHNAKLSLSVLVLIPVLCVQIFFQSKKIKSFSGKISKNVLPLVVLGGFFVHLLFANFGWLIRYEAYLVVLILWAIAPFLENVFSNFRQMKIVGLGILVLFSVTFEKRFITTLKKQQIASKNIFDQQIQMANFIHKYYNHSKIIANDIGAITYFSDIHLLDTFGLGSIEVAKLKVAKFRKHGKNENNENVQSLRFKSLQSYFYKTAKAENFDIALVYDSWAKMPDYFTKVGTLTLTDNYICGGKTVSFYSVKKENAEKLRNQLKEFSAKTPKDVIVKIIN